MAEPLKNENFLCVSAYIRALEAKLLSEADMTRMLEANSNDEALRVLAEHGYAVAEENMAAVETALRSEQETLFEDLGGFQMDSRVFDFFRVRQDYHNAKVVLKANALGLNADALLMSGGRVEAEELRRIIQEGDDAHLPAGMESAVVEARRQLATSGNPQESDFTLDRGLYGEMLAIAQSTENEFLIGYAKLLIDVANANALARVLKMTEEGELFSDAVIEGGNVDTKTLKNAAQNGAITEPYQGSVLFPAIETIGPILHTGTMTAFERTCDDVLTDYLRRAALVPYGIEPVVAYIAAKQQEITNIRIIMSGRFAALRQSTIRERMREAYV